MYLRPIKCKQDMFGFNGCIIYKRKSFAMHGRSVFTQCCSPLFSFQSLKPKRKYLYREEKGKAKKTFKKVKTFESGSKLMSDNDDEDGDENEDNPDDDDDFSSHFLTNQFS